MQFIHTKELPTYLIVKKKRYLENLMLFFLEKMTAGRFKQGMDLYSQQEILKKAFSLKKISHVAISINSPGGTVSASNELYNSFLTFKKKSNASIIFHTSEILASGGYWASLSGEKIYASYGSIIGSIGVKGPDWFYFNKPKLISSGLLGQTIEVENEIEVYSTNAGKSKAIGMPIKFSDDCISEDAIDVSKNLKDGEVSKPIQISNGFLILKLFETYSVTPLNFLFRNVFLFTGPLINFVIFLLVNIRSYNLTHEK